MNNHVCLLGPSGIGKGTLSGLFKLSGFEPFRVREPRDDNDRLVCKSEDDTKKIFQLEGFQEKEWEFNVDKDDWYKEGPKWIFFSVRGKRQCLRYKDENDKLFLESPKRIEIFAPRLLQILNDPVTLKTIGLKKEELFIIILNPTEISYTTLLDSDFGLREAVFYGITKRTELQGKPVNIPDTLKRVKDISDELKAWKELITDFKDNVIEIKSWKHFEFCYYQPNKEASDAKRELRLARDRILVEFGKNANFNVLKNTIRSEEEILMI